jgi:hypothetical protein
VEYRSRATRIIGERFHIYASKGSGFRVQGSGRGKAWSRDLAMPRGDEGLPAWMIELAEQVGMIEAGALALLPRGVIVGSAVIDRVTRNDDDDDLFQWHLTDVQRARTLRKPRGHPQPVWFEPFD